MKKIILILIIIATILTVCNLSGQIGGGIPDKDVATLQETSHLNQTQSKKAKPETATSVTESNPTSQAAASTPTSAPKTTSLPPNDDGSPPKKATAPQAPIAESISRPYLEMEKEAARLVNLERERVGLPPLETDDTYYSIVSLRAKECTEAWSHTRPNGKPWSSLYQELEGLTGVRKIEENLGINFTTAAQITESLMNSENHRKPILSSDDSHLCIAIVLSGTNLKGENLYAIAQHFYQKEELI